MVEMPSITSRQKAFHNTVAVSLAKFSCTYSSAYCPVARILKCVIVADYRFLEEVGCYVDSIDRDGVVRGCQKRRGLNVNHCSMVL